MALKLGRKVCFGKTIINEFDEIVGLAIEMSDGSWGAFDRDEKRLTAEKYRKPADVLRFFEGKPSP